MRESRRQQPVRCNSGGPSQAPAETGWRLRFYQRGANAPRTVRVSLAADLELETLLPIRTPTGYRGKHSMPSLVFCVTLHRHVMAESRRERRVLLELDRDPRVIGIAAQPFELRTGDRLGYVPDLAVLLADGRRRVIDVAVSPDAGRTAQLERACGICGWEYEVTAGPQGRARAELELLAGFRDPPAYCHTLGPALLEACASPRAIADVIAAVDAPAVLVRPVLLHLVWSGAIRRERDEIALDDMTLVVARRMNAA
jgi:hypothetical protein